MGKNLYELTNPQKSIVLTEQYYKGSCINSIAGTLIINQTVDFDLLEKSINTFIKNNDSIRIKLSLEDNETKQYVEEYTPISIPIKSIKDATCLKEIEDSTISTPFELLDEFLFEFVMFKFENGQGGYIAKLHHAISDAWTMSLLINQIMSIYSALLQNSTSIEELDTPKPSYLDFIQSEKEYLSSNKFNKSKEFWNNQFDEELNLTYLNDTFCSSCKANRVSFSLENSKEITEFCKELKISAYSLFMSVVGIYLAKISNSDYFIIGSPVLNRSNFAEKNMTGMFISTVPFKCDFDKNSNYLEFISAISKNEFSIFRHQKYPYDALLNDIRQKHNITKNLFDIAISYQNARDNKNSNLVDYSSYWFFNGCVSNSMDIHIYDMDDTGILTLYYDYKAELFQEKEVLALHQRLMYIMKQILSNKEILLKDIEIVTPKEKHLLLETYNNTKTEYPFDTPIYRLFEKQVLKTPNKVAISDKEVSLTYAQLNICVNHLVHKLEKENIGYQDKVCLFFENSIELVTCILALLKMGVTYIPIDISYPDERIGYILENSNAKKILTNRHHINQLNVNKDSILEINLSDLEYSIPCNNPNYEVTCDDLAYMIYTSGSTGNPKGVKISNKSLTNYIYWAVKQYVNKEETNFPLYSSIAFDLTVTSIFTPLISGNAIYIYQNSNPELLLKEIVEDNKVHIIKLTPAHLSLLLDCVTFPTKVSKLIVGGDILTNEICDKITEKFNNAITIYNEYGPTEATVGCMIYEYQKTDTAYASVPVGVPIDNTKVYLLNDDLQLVPFGQLGQMYLSGDCLAKGYLNLEEITNSRFIDNPFCSGEKLYQTGDIAKMQDIGIIEYIGRSDFQVKINGYRIEIGEIQSRLLNYPMIKDCFVTVLELNHHKMICAYYVSCDEIDLTDLKNYLFNCLPPYMVPKYFTKLDAIPLTANGKVNKTLLPMPNHHPNIVEFTTPQTEVEEILHSIFCELLKCSSISTSCNIFDYYIDSLLLIKAQTMLFTKGITVNTQNFYEHTTIKELADYITKSLKQEKQVDAIDTFPKLENIQTPIVKPEPYKNILLFGSTGFLGIHILHKLLLNTTSHIYCLIRNKDNINFKDRFYHKFVYYFSEEELNRYQSRIHIVQGNILEDNFGLPTDTYIKLGKILDTVVDAAAIVKHYGDYKLFEDTNVNGTKKIIEFCKKYHLPFHYVSTLSVCGYGLVPVPNNAMFTENDLYIGQEYKDNVYVRSKFEAEALILEECKNNGLIASIYRVGNMTNRYFDGMFQENAKENAFLNRLLAFLNLRMYS